MKVLSPTLALSLLLVPAALAGGASSGRPAECRDAVSWRDAHRVAGRHATVRGPVIETYLAEGSSGSPTFLDLGRSYPNAGRVTVIIWSQDRAAFGGAPELRFRDKTVCVTGNVYLENGVPRIEAAAARQIRVIGTAPAVAPEPPPVSPTGRPGGYAPTSTGSQSLGRDN